jgi:para-aminobenzoate synthetase/4-amino-4-deoxychorismate lyase
MQLIADLEDSPRGVYCGAVGYLAPPGSGHPAARFNVPIRTVIVDAETHAAEYGVGGGITWDSRAAGEYDETVAKARVLVERRPAFELYETILHEPTAGFRHLERHLARLRASCDYFGFAFDEPAIVAAAEREAARFPDRAARIRVVVDRRGRVTSGGLPLPEPVEPVRVALDETDPVDPSDPMVFHKTTRRRRFEEAKARHPGADDVLLTNTRGEITETTIANVAIELGGHWWTPPLDAGLLPGVGRELALEEGRIAERPITVAELDEAEEVALVSDNRGWRRVRLVD